MDTQIVRVEIVVHDLNGWHYRIVTDWEGGQARGLLDYATEPTRGQLEHDIKAWAKNLKHGSPPSAFNVNLREGEE